MRLLRILTIAILISAALGQLNRLFIGDDSNVVLYANDIVMGLMTILYLGYVLLVRRSWQIPRIMLGLWLFLAVGLFGLIVDVQVLGKNELAVSLFYLLRYLSYTTIFFIVYDSLKYAQSAAEHRTWLMRWSAVTMIAAVLVALSGFIQLYILPDLALLTKYGWDPHVNRLVTSMLDPNFAGCYLSIGAGLAVSCYLYSHRLWQKGILLVVIGLTVTAILLTYSRSGYLTLGIVLSVIAIVKSRSLLVVGAIVAVMAFAFVPRVQERVVGALQGDATTSLRVISWENSLLIAHQRPLFGVGFNSYRYAQDRYGILSLADSGNAGAGADSSWLFVLATTGLAGLGVFVLTYAGMAWLGIKAFRQTDRPLFQAVSLAFLGSIAGLAVASQFNNALFYTWILEPFWLMAGLVVALSEYRPWPSSKATS